MNNSIVYDNKISENAGREKWLKVNDIYCGDSKILLKSIKPNSIACSIWSPPYHTGKSYEKGMTFDDWKELLETIIALHYPIIIPGGFLAINTADILSFKDPEMPRIQAMNLNKRKCSISSEDVIKTKTEHPDYNRFQLAKLLGCSEQTIDRRLNDNNVRGGKYQSQTKVKLVGGIIEQYAESAGFYLYDRRIWVKDPAWENCKWHSLSYRSVDEFEYIYIFWKPGITIVDRNRLSANEWGNWGSRAVWNFPSVRANYEHEAMFPKELPRRLIRMLTKPGDIILDCFVGSGTTAIATIEENRRYIGIDLTKKYANLARKKCNKLKKQQ